MSEEEYIGRLKKHIEKWQWRLKFITAPLALFNLGLFGYTSFIQDPDRYVFGFLAIFNGIVWWYGQKVVDILIKELEEYEGSGGDY